MKLSNLSIVLLFIGISYFAEASDRTISGSYTVPTGPDFAPHASFDFEGTLLDAREGERAFKYFLPSDLVGSENIEISLKEKGKEKEFLLFEGYIANASCIPSKDTLMCFIYYHTLAIDEETIEGFLKKKYADSEDLDSKIKIASFFRETPGGVVRFELSE